MPSKYHLQTLATLERFRGEPFTVADLEAAAIDPRRLTTLLKNGLVQRVRKGCYRVGPEPSEPKATLHAASEITRAVPSAIVSHESAAELLGIPHLDSYRMFANRPNITITTPHGTHQGRNGYRTVSAHVPGDQIVEVAGIPVTSPARTAIDIARMSDLKCGLAAIDAVLREVISNDVGEDERAVRYAVHDPDRVSAAKHGFDTILRGMTRWPGVARARYAVRHAHPAAESPLESASRATMIDAGLPLPQIGTPFHSGAQVYWLDFMWDELMVVGESDGALKYESGSREVLLAEKRREDVLRDAGYRVVRWGWYEAVVNPDLLVAKLLRTLHLEQARVWPRSAKLLPVPDAKSGGRR